MNAADLIPLLHHERWANERVMTTLLGLQEMPQRASEIFAHIISAGAVWLARVEGETPIPAPWNNALTPNLWTTEIARINSRWLQLLEQPGISSKTVSYTNTSGQAFTNTVAQIITHLCMHGQYHRGQIITLIRPLVPQVPPTDYIAYLRL